MKLGLKYFLISLIFPVSALILYSAYQSAGHRVIEQMTRGQSASFLNSLIRHPELHSVDYYFLLADSSISKIIYGILSIFAIWILCPLKIKQFYYYVIFIITVIFCVLFYHFSTTHDFFYHLFKLTDVVHNFKTGNWQMVFSETLANGKGLPVYVFYSAWVYFFPAFLTMIGVTELLAIKIAFILFYMLTATGMFFVLREFVDKEQAASGALLFLGSNYVVGEIFYRFAYAEFASYSFLPLVFLFFYRWLKNEKVKDMLAFILLSCVMLLFHPLTLINVSPGFFISAIFIGVARGNRRPKDWTVFFLKNAAGVFFLLLATISSWLPMLMEIKYVQGTRGLPVPDISESAMKIKDYFWADGFYVPGLAIVFGFILCFFIFMFQRNQMNPDKRFQSGLFAFLALFYVFLTLPPGLFFWRYIPFAKAGQFIWRLTFCVSFYGTIFITTQLSGLRRIENGKLQNIISGALILFSLFLIVFLWPPISGSSERPDFASKFLEKYKTSEKGWGISEFLPVPAETSLIPKETLYQAIRPASVEKESGKIKFRFDPVKENGFYIFPRFWHVRYRAETGGRQCPILAAPSGEIVVPLKAQDNELTLFLAKPSYVSVSEKVSLAVIFFLCLCYFLVV